MKGEPVPDTDHILRYVAPGKVGEDDQGKPLIAGAAFIAKPKDNNRPSYNWLECFDGPLVDKVAQVRQLARLRYAAKGRLVRLNVGEVCSHIRENTDNGHVVTVVHDPRDPDPVNSCPADPSHAVMTDVPGEDDPFGEEIGDLIAECILDVFPARAPGS
jgi:hypothetical protein